MKCAVCPAESETDLGLCSVHDAAFRSEAREAAEKLQANPNDAEAEKLARSILNNHVRLAARQVTGRVPSRDLDFTEPGLFQRLRASQKERAQQQPPAPQQQEQRTGQPGILEDFE